MRKVDRKTINISKVLAGPRLQHIDEPRGLVFAFAFFDHDGTVRDYALADGTPRSGIDRPFTWMIAEAFRIERGLLTRIEALMAEVPYGHRSGWV